MPVHTVGPAETLQQIAGIHGVAVDRICNAPENQELFATRGPNLLFEGDEVFVPDDPEHTYLSDDEVHTFVYRPAMKPVQVQILRGGVPRPHVPVEWSVDSGEATADHLDSQGWFLAKVPLAAQELLLVLHPGEAFEERRTIHLGRLDPVVETRGLQQRLNNVGFHCGVEDGDAADKTKAALEAFQLAHGLEPSGEIDEQTRELLTQRHGI